MDRSDKRSATLGKTNGEASTSNSINNRHVRDLFHEEAQGCPRPSQPWWKVQVFVWEPVLFGTWDGVFTTCMINIFGVVLFLRTGYLVGNTGVVLGIVLVSSVVLVALVTVMSGIGVSERCGVGSGGVYSMISTVLGGRVGGTVGLLYVFGQCVAGAMYITGFSESVAELLGLQSQWAVRGMSVAVLLGLLGINLAGVKWIVRLQLLLLAVLAVSTLDFVVGTFTHLDPGRVTGAGKQLLSNNTMTDYSPGENFFTVFGVFFPAATGVMAGFNMIGSCTWCFVFLLGAICTREVLRDDFLIAEKVSLVGFLFLLGLYVSSLASCMGSLYGAPRILQCIAQERVYPVLTSLIGGPDRTPVAAICLTTVLTMAFIFIGQVNVLAPIVTINFLLTYSFVDYAYFSVAMACRRLPPRAKADTLPPAKRLHLNPAAGKGTLLEFTQDMDRIFSLDANENLKVESDEGTAPAPSSSSSSSSAEKSRTARDGAKQTLLESFSLDQSSNLSRIEEPPRGASEAENGCGEDAIAGPVPLPRAPQVEAAQKPSLGQQDLMACPQNPNTGDRLHGMDGPLFLIATPDSSYGIFCNPWVALIGVMVYALANIMVALMLFLYIGKTSPGLPGGHYYISFPLRKASLRDQMVMTPSLSLVGMETRQLTEENADFASRHRHHQSSYIEDMRLVQLH
uniref:Solute carrier family 12 member 8 n=1 Tax=Gadus morhua TaxID=8049 RepID=A0A8C5F3A4_GADMO